MNSICDLNSVINVFSIFTFDMRTFEKYLVFVLSVLGMVLAASSDENNDFNKEMLDLHNEHRAKHNVLPLELHPKLMSAALKCAENWNRGESEIHENNWTYGDNKYTNYYFNTERDFSKETAAYVFSSWYNEGENYDYTREPLNVQKDNVENFTQIVWKETRYMGAAKVSGSGRTMVVAVYSPAGNKRGSYKRNVREPTGILKKKKKIDDYLDILD